MSGANFNGSTSVGGLNLSGFTALDSDQLLIHGWINPRPNGSAAQYLFANTGLTVTLRLLSNGRLRFECEDVATGADIVVLSPVQAFNAFTGWTAIDIVVDTTQGFARMYYNGVSVDSGAPTAQTIDWSQNNYIVGARTSTTDSYEGDIFQLSFYNSFSADYVSSTGELTAKYFVEMYDLDQDGVIYPKETSISAALGTQPLILLEGEYDAFGTNTGSEGNLTTVLGAPLPLTSLPPFGNWTFTA